MYRLRASHWRAADAVTSLCNTYAAAAAEAAPDVGRTVIHNGTDVAFFQTRVASTGRPAAGTVGKDAGEVCAVFAGTLGRNYDVPAMLRAAEIVRRRRPRLRLVVCGDGPLAPDVVTASRKTVTYLGRLDQISLRDVYAQCDIGIAAYGCDSNVAMPDKGYDYLAAGLAIVHSLGGEFRSLVEDEQVGFRYEPGDSGSLADCLVKLHDDRELRQSMQQRAAKLAWRFDAGSQYSRLFDVLSDAIQRRARRSAKNCDGDQE